MVLLGLFLGAHVKTTMERRAATVYASMTETMFHMADGVIVQPEDMALDASFSPDRAAVLDGLIGRLATAPGTVHVEIAHTDGRVVYSTNRADLGSRIDLRGPAQDALAGTAASRFVRGSVVAGAPESNLIELYIPVKFPGSDVTHGVLVASGIDGSLVPSIHNDVRRTQLIVAGALVALWLVLLPISASVSRRLRRQSAENRHLALHDTLTGLPNRDLLADRLEHAIASTARTGEMVGLLLIDLDRFKEVNDTLGHGKGDELLVHVANQLRGAVRGGDTVCRLGGDEFAVLLTGVSDTKELELASTRIANELVEPFAIDGVEIAVQASIGAAAYPLHAEHSTDLLQRADIAMYAAKAAGWPSAIYSADIDSHSPSRLALAADLRRAATADTSQLIVHFQPVADPRTGSVEAMEALVRWQHPTRGVLPPMEFIPLAEQTGLVREITRHVLDVAISQVHAWAGDGLELSVCVNLSARDLRDDSIVDDIRAALGRHEVAAHLLEVEVTETAVLANPDAAVTIINKLRDLGVRIALDDFGTGYSSLTYLKRLSPDRLKIDRSFVDAMTHQTTDSEIVRSVIALAHSLHIGVTAEGVETSEHWQLLEDLACDLVQGYYLARPLPADDATAWLKLHDLSRHVAH
jgi:diguanylate cyclase (GGDEF)-like protein